MTVNLKIMSIVTTNRMSFHKTLKGNMNHLTSDVAQTVHTSQEAEVPVPKQDMWPGMGQQK
jgi:hypothetical protein